MYHSQFNKSLPSWVGESRCLRKGHFSLKSGLHSDYYVDKYAILEDPFLVDELACCIADQIVELDLDHEVDAVLSAAVGGIVLVTG